MNTNTKYTLWGICGIFATFLLLLALPASFEWSSEEQEVFSAEDRSALEELNEQFEVTKIISLSQNRLIGASKELPLYANVLTGLKKDDAISQTEILLQATNGEIMLLESTAKNKQEQMIAAYSNLPSITVAEENMNGSLFAFDQRKDASSESLHSPVSSPTSESPIVIAVIDSGIDTTHPAFSSAMWKNSHEYSGSSSTDDDRNSFVDDRHGWNFAGNNTNISDEIGHGTHIAGIIAGQKTHLSHAQGVASDSADLMILKITDRTGILKLSSVISALSYAHGKNADIVNMSLGFPQESAILKGVLQKMNSDGIVLIAAAGNSTSSTKQYPAGYPETLAVGASNVSGGGLWKTSNFGDWVDVFAPAKLESALPGGKYGSKSGTSQAAAFVTGFYAYYKNQFPEKTPEETRRALTKYMNQFYKGYASSDLPSLAQNSWIHESINMLKNNSLPTLADTLRLNLSKRVTFEETQAFLIEFFGKQAPLQKILETKEIVSAPDSIAPHELLSKKYTASLFGEKESSSSSSSLTPTRLVKSYEAIALMRRVQTDVGGYESLKSFPLRTGVDHLKYISRQEFLELAFQILE